MFSATLPFHGISPIALSIGPVDIRWYSLGYIFGILIAWYVAKRLVRANPLGDLKESDIDDLIGFAAIGIIAGGRIGYVLFYNFAYYIKHPLEILMIMDGGMSFHGGLIGVILAFTLFSVYRGLHFRALGDIVATVAGFGILLVRLANFINGELYGRVSDVPWAMEFPGAVGARHPSQLYEAFLEGLVVTCICLWLISKPAIRARAGFTGGVFLMGYGLSRIFVEFFRQPDNHIGFIGNWLTMGMILSLPMVILGIGAIVWSRLTAPIKVQGYNP